MKTLADGSQVSARGFYFLLDWNDRNNKVVMVNLYGMWRLHDLTLHQYMYLMEQAMADELKQLKNGQH